jgi:hypothetical protein
MKVTQTIETKYNQFYVGYGYAEFKDEVGNLVNIKCTDDNILEMYETIAYKRERILKQRADEAAHLASQTQESENE